MVTNFLALPKKYHKLDALNIEILSHGSGRQKSKMKALAGPVPSEAMREDLVHSSLLAAGVCWHSDLLWLVEASP